MRDLNAKKNVLEIQDGLSGDVHEIYYRMPDNNERTAFMAACVERKGKKIKIKTYEARVRFGLRIITGFKKGTLGVDGRAFASEPNDPDFREDWKKLMEESAADIVAAVGAQVFEGTGVKQENGFDLEVDGGDLAGDEDGEEGGPLAQG